MLDRAVRQRGWRRSARSSGLKLEPDTLVADLSIGEQQRLEIIKALIRGARILILDEPTAALTPHETDGLFDAVRAMAARGMGVILISHKLQEVRAVTNRIMVMRLGAVWPSGPTMRRSARSCWPTDVRPRNPADGQNRPRRRPGADAPSLASRTSGGERRRLKDLSLEVRGGEIVGIAGVSGNGQRELADVIVGRARAAWRARSRSTARRSIASIPARPRRMGIGRIPEDRMGTGLITQSPLAESMALPRIREAPFSRHGLLDRGAIRILRRGEIAKFDIRAAGPLVRTGTLSGGNLQKALLARELACDPLVRTGGAADPRPRRRRHGVRPRQVPRAARRGPRPAS